MIHLREKRYEYWEEANEGILRQFPVSAPAGGGLVLDVGCGSGALAERIAARGYTVWGIEREVSAAAGARSRIGKVVEADLVDIPKVRSAIAETRFDYLVFSDVLEHLVDPLSVLLSYLPFLKPGGVLLVSVPNIAVWSSRFALFFGRFTYTATGVMDRTHVRFFTFRSARELIAATGCRVEAVDYTPYLVRAFLPLIKRLLAPRGRGAGKGDILSSPFYAWYLKWVYPVEYLIGWPCKRFTAFRIIIKAGKI